WKGGTMPVYRITGHRFGWSFAQKAGFFQIQTAELGWGPSVGIKNVEGLAAIGVLLEGSAFWDSDASAILNAEQTMPFQNLFDSKSRGADISFPKKSSRRVKKKRR